MATVEYGENPFSKTPDNAESVHLHVACAIIERNGLVLAAQRSGTMSLPLKWEFPGGKLQPGETPEQCLHRELREELGIQVCIETPLPTRSHRYPVFTVTLYPFVCTMVAGDLELREHAAIAWLPAAQLFTLDWAEADIPVIRSYVANSDR